MPASTGKHTSGLSWGELDVVKVMLDGGHVDDPNIAPNGDIVLNMSLLSTDKAEELIGKLING